MSQFRNRLGFKFLSICLFFSSVSLGQKSTGDMIPVNSSPKGNYILLLPKDTSNGFSRKEQYTISRREKGADKFTEIAQFSPVKTWSEFVKIVGEPFAESVKKQVKVKTNEEVIHFLQTNKNMEAYGFLTYNIDFLSALGFGYLDPVPEARAMNYEYRVTDQGGKVQYQHSPGGFNKNMLPKVLVSRIATTDSMVNIGWQMPVVQSTFPLLAKVFRQDRGAGKYVEQPQKLIFNNEGKMMTLFFEESLKPEELVNYYVVPVDFFGNEGNPSDTVSAITIDFNKVAGVQNVSIKDTLDGLLAQWDRLPSKPYYTGIQVLRSADVRQDYLVLDSLAASATSYLDKQVLPGVSYYYKFRVLLYQLAGVEEIPATAAQGTKNASEDEPLPPKNLTAANEGENILLTWDHNTEIDIFGYYVLRGTSSTNMEIVSPIVKDTFWIDSTTNLSGRTNYVYSLLAMNNNQVRSGLANSVGIRPERGGFIQSPSGISFRRTGKQVTLSWQDVQKENASVAGYILYRKKATEKEFIPLKNEMIRQPYFEDANIENNIVYHYMVAAVDYFGYESEPSPEASFSLAERMSPPANLYVRKISLGVEISWPPNNNERIISYTVYRKVVGDKNFTKLGNAQAGENLFIDRKFIPNKLNVYAVTVNYQGGESEKSVEKAITVKR